MPVPKLGDRIAVIAFDGWNDAGEAATSAVQRLAALTDQSVVVSVDPELYFDYQYTRPTVASDGAGGKTLRWPEATLRRPEVLVQDTPITQLWTLTGSEPARNWQSFAATFVDALLTEGVNGVVTIGSMMGDAPHTRPISVFASSENADVRDALGVERSLYEGPVGILSVLGQAAEHAGIPSLSLWASVPHYVAGHTPSPKAALALLQRLAELTGAPIDTGDLEAEARTWEATIDAAAAEDDEMGDYIRQLEQARDTWDSPEASGDAIAQEFERYLRRGDGKDGRGHGDQRR